MIITKLLLAILQVYSYLVLARAVLSWVNPSPRHELLVWVIRLTEPVLAPLRRAIPLSGIDISPMVAWVLIRILMKFVIQAGI